MNRFFLILFLFAAAACSTPTPVQQLRQGDSIEHANKKYTLLLVNYTERSDYDFRKAAAGLVEFLRGCGYPAFYTDQKVNVVVTVGQFDENETEAADRLVKSIMADSRLKAIEPLWKRNRNPFTALEVPVLKKTLTQNKPWGRLIKPNEVKPSPAPKAAGK